MLVFSNTMNKLVKEIELKTKLETIFSGLMVGMELDSKNGSLAGLALDMMFKLVALEYKHKSWNYFGLYTNCKRELLVEWSKKQIDKFKEDATQNEK